jgi:hypothetical protein
MMASSASPCSSGFVWTKECRASRSRSAKGVGEIFLTDNVTRRTEVAPGALGDKEIAAGGYDAWRSKFDNERGNAAEI